MYAFFRHNRNDCLIILMLAIVGVLIMSDISATPAVQPARLIVTLKEPTTNETSTLNCITIPSTKDSKEFR